MSIVREWGATFWARRPADAFLQGLAEECKYALLDEVPDAVILDASAYSLAALRSEDVPPDYDFVGVLIKYTSDAEGAS